MTIDLYAPGSSRVAQGTSSEKMRGQFSTPPALAQEMLALTSWPNNGGDLLDAGCGDGVFLLTAFHKAISMGLDPMETASRLHGWDICQERLDACRAAFTLEARAMRLDPDALQVNLELKDVIGSDGSGEFSCVVGNPPYLEAKRMAPELKRHIKRHCATASGAFDLYGAFIETALRLTNDEICFVVPNRLLVAAWAKELRRLLLYNMDIEVHDISAVDRGLPEFKAAVYPVVLHCKEGSHGFSFRKRYSCGPLPRSSAGRSHRLKLPQEVLIARTDTVMPTAPLHSEGAALIERVLSDPALMPLSRVADIRWAISFHRTGLRNEFIFDTEPDSEHRKPFVGGKPYFGNREVGHYSLRWAGYWIDYDEQRARSEKNSLPPASLFEGRKLVVPCNARRCRAAIDEDSRAFKDTFLVIKLKDKVPSMWLEWLAIVLNSDVFHYLYEHLYGGTRKGGGYLQFLPRFLGNFPIPRFSKAVGELGHEGLQICYKRLGEAINLCQQTDPEKMQLLTDLGLISDLPSTVEGWVRESYGVQGHETLALEEFVFPSMFKRRQGH